MKGNYTYFNYMKSVERVDEILDSSENNYEEKKIIPSTCLHQVSPEDWISV